MTFSPSCLRSCASRRKIWKRSSWYVNPKLILFLLPIDEPKNRQFTSKKTLLLQTSRGHQNQQPIFQLLQLVLLQFSCYTLKYSKLSVAWIMDMSEACIAIGAWPAWEWLVYAWHACLLHTRTAWICLCRNDMHVCILLTYNMTLIHTSFMRSKWNMDDILA